MKKNYKLLMVFCTCMNLNSLIGAPADKQLYTRNLLVNGSFENGKPEDFGPIPGWSILGNPGGRPVGFTKTLVGFVPAYLPSEGSRMVVFSSGSNDFSGGIYQDFSTVTGATYSFKFKMGIVTESARRSQVLQVAIVNGDGASIHSRIETITASKTGTTWMNISGNFVAAGKKTRFAISDLSEILPRLKNYNTDLLVDDIVVLVQTSHDITKFQQWMMSYKASGKIEDDFDKDLMNNGLEYVVGTNPAINTGSSFFPKTNLSFSDPDGDGKKDKYLVLSYRRSKKSFDDNKVSTEVEWRATNKGTWKNIKSIKGIISKTIKNKYPGNVDLVYIYIPRSITKNGNLITRLKVISKK
jgi:hypothetical protein